MNMKVEMIARRKSVCFLLISVFVFFIACSPRMLSDAEFARNAISTCNKLTITSMRRSGSGLDSDPFRLAEYELGKFSINEESAPNAILLRTGLIEYAQAADALNKAIHEALERGNIRINIHWTVSQSGLVMYFLDSEGMSEIKPLDVDTSFGRALLAARRKINDAARALGMETCVIGDDY